MGLSRLAFLPLELPKRSILRLCADNNLILNGIITLTGIMSIFTESVTGNKGAAYFMTLIVGCTIFGSVFSMMCGFSFLLFAAARDGYFYAWFSHRHSKYENLPDRA